MSTDRDTPSEPLESIQLDQRQNLALLLGEVRGSRREIRRLQEDMESVKESLASGTTTFATTDLRVQALAARVLTLEQERERSSRPQEVHWLVKSALQAVVGVLAIALLWFLLQGAVANAHGPVAAQPTGRVP